MKATIKMQRAIELRRAKRYQLSAPTFFLWAPQHKKPESGHGVTRDINTFGVYVLTDSLPPVGALLQMEILLPKLMATGFGMLLHGEGIVLRTDSHSTEGIGALGRGFAASVQFCPNQRNRFSRTWRVLGKLCVSPGLLTRTESNTRLFESRPFHQTGYVKRHYPGKDGEAMSKIREQQSGVNSFGSICAAADNPLRWFAAYTTPRHEKHVSEILAERQIETFLPLYRAGRHWKKSLPVILELPLFPTYVFVRIARQARAAVLGIPGVLSIVGSSREPWPLPELEINALRWGLRERNIEPHSYLKVGERVRIKAGVMTGVEGVLVRTKNCFRVVLSLDTIMRSVAVEVDADDIETVPTFAECHAIPWTAQAEA